MSEHIKVYDDFIGFTFNGKHCSEFGLLRTSDGDRYEDNLVLSLSDSAEDVPGGVGQYYFGENIKQREFNIRVAYDSVTEKDKREIRKWLHPDDKLHELIFDEKPYVKYWVKCNKEVKSKELCFNELGNTISYKKASGNIDISTDNYYIYAPDLYKIIGNNDDARVVNIKSGKEIDNGYIEVGSTPYYYGHSLDAEVYCISNIREYEQRVYKGEFTINFVAYMPYGVAAIKTVDDAITGGYRKPPESYGNFEEWYENSGLLDTIEYSYHINGLMTSDAYHYETQIYNPGDVETGFEFTIDKGAAGVILEAYNNGSSSGAYQLVNEKNLDISLSPNEYFIFNPELYKLSGTNIDTKVISINNGTEIDNGYISNDTEISLFVSNSTGIKYEILKYNGNIKFNYYYFGINSALPTFIKFKKKYIAIDDNNNIVNFYVKEPNIFIKIVNYGEDCGTSNIGQLKFLPDYDVFINCGITTEGIPSDFPVVQPNFLNDYYFQLKIPAGASIEPQYWTEAQKMLYLPCQLKIDTNKQLIQYREIINSAQQLYGPWIGIGGVINKGRLFKIPLFADKNSERYPMFIFSSADSTKLNLSGASTGNLKYNYLYI